MRAKVDIVRLLVLSCVLALDFLPIACSRIKEPSKADIVGIWLPDDKTIKYLKYEGKYPDYDKIKFIFKDDGTFEAVLPDLYYTNEWKSYSIIHSISGTWKIESEHGRVWRISMSSGRRTTLDIHWDGSSYILYSYVGDPDTNKTLDYIKLR